MHIEFELEQTKNIYTVTGICGQKILGIIQFEVHRKLTFTIEFLKTPRGPLSFQNFLINK